MTPVPATVPLVRVEEREGVAVLTLDRPRANAISPELIEDLRRALRESAGAPAVVSSSQKIFSAGWDLPLLVGRDRASDVLQ